MFNSVIFVMFTCQLLFSFQWRQFSKQRFNPNSRYLNQSRFLNGDVSKDGLRLYSQPPKQHATTKKQKPISKVPSNAKQWKSTPSSRKAVIPVIDPSLVHPLRRNSQPKVLQKGNIRNSANDGISKNIFEIYQRNPTKLLKSLKEHSVNKTFSQDMAAKAIRTLSAVETLEYIPYSDIVQYWKQSIDDHLELPINIKSTVALIKELSFHKNMTQAVAVAEKCNVFVRNDQFYEVQKHRKFFSESSETNVDTSSCQQGFELAKPPLTAVVDNTTNLESNVDLDSQWAPLTPTEFELVLLPELALGHGHSLAFQSSLSYLETMCSHKMTVTLQYSKLLLNLFLKQSDLYNIRKCLRLLVSMGGLTDQESVILLTRQFMKSIEFVKGSVDMETLPPEICPEVAFIGRSNVGKSSLLNLVCNRKSLAYTSKTPGKTSEFNYFNATGAVGKEQNMHQFYLVDLPGVGYAEVKRAKKRSWMKFFYEYVNQRSTLRLLFHLIDSRHGFMKSDKNCLEVLQTLPPYVHYVIVLTKADKRGGGIKVGMIEKIQRVLQEYSLGREASAEIVELSESDDEDETYDEDDVNNDADADNDVITQDSELLSSRSLSLESPFGDFASSTASKRKFPIVLTSSEMKQGGTALWSLILDAISGDDASQLFFKYKMNTASVQQNSPEGDSDLNDLQPNNSEGNLELENIKTIVEAHGQNESQSLIEGDVVVAVNNDIANISAAVSLHSVSEKEAVLEPAITDRPLRRRSLISRVRKNLT